MFIRNFKKAGDNVNEYAHFSKELYDEKVLLPTFSINILRSFDKMGFSRRKRMLINKLLAPKYGCCL